MAQLTSRSLVKQLSNLNETDTRFDTMITAMIESACDQVEHILERTFTYAAYTEFHRSYSQSFSDPDQQYIWVQSPPIDDAETITVVWALRNDHDVNGISLTQNNDWTLTEAKDGIIIDRLRSIDTAFLPVGRSHILSYAPRGFKVSYTGGFALPVAAAVAATGFIELSALPLATESLVFNTTHFEFTAGASSASGSLPTGSHGNPILVTLASGTITGVIDELIGMQVFPDYPALAALATITNENGNRFRVIADTAGVAGNTYTLEQQVTGATISAVTLEGGSAGLTDPLDEPELVQVPAGLQLAIALKVSSDIMRVKASRRFAMKFGADRHDLRDFAEVLLPWTPKQIETLNPYRRKDRMS